MPFELSERYINPLVSTNRGFIQRKMNVIFISSELVHSPPRVPHEVTLVMIMTKKLPAALSKKSVQFSQQITEVRHEPNAIKTLHCQENATCKISTESVSGEDARYISQAPIYSFHPSLYAPNVKLVRRNGMMIEKHPRYGARVLKCE